MNPVDLIDFGVQVEKNVPLSFYTTFRLGGPCPLLFHCQTPEQLETAVRCLNKEKKDFILIGGGSNLVVSDKGLDLAVIRYVSHEPQIERRGNELIVSCSTQLDDLAKFAANEGLEGLNYTSGIPGTVGGAIVGNAGAFGRQVGDALKSVVLLTKNGRKEEVKPESLDFRYRHSNLKERDDIVLAATFLVNPAEPSVLLNEREEILRVRREKHPDLITCPCAGSFFRNIEPTSKAERRQAAGWFLEQAGGKSLSVGGARIFEKHANIIVRADGCKAEDVFALSERMADIVFKKFDLKLIREVRFVGKFKKMPLDLKNVMW